MNSSTINIIAVGMASRLSEKLSEQSPREVPTPPILLMEAANVLGSLRRRVATGKDLELLKKANENGIAGLDEDPFLMRMIFGYFIESCGTSEEFARQRGVSLTRSELETLQTLCDKIRKAVMPKAGASKTVSITKQLYGQLQTLG